MSFDDEKRLQVINYIVNSLDSSDGLSKEFVGKIAYMANKLFLLKYGCTITGDKLVAMERGTTCSETLGIMDKDVKYAKDKEIIKSFERQYEVTLRPHSKKVHTIFPKSRPNDKYDTLSKKEMEILDIIIQRFGNMSANEISIYTHQFKEWEKFENSGEKSLEINMDEVFEDETFWKDKELSKYLNKEHRTTPQDIHNGDLD